MTHSAQRRERFEEILEANLSGTAFIYHKDKFIEDSLLFLDSEVEKAVLEALKWIEPPKFEGKINYPEGLPNADELMMVNGKMQIIKEGYEICRTEVLANSKWYLENKISPSKQHE